MVEQESTNTAEGPLTGLMATWNSIVEDVKSGKIKLHQGFECRECFNSGFRQVPDPQGSIYRGVVRCDACRYWQFAREKMRNG